ncbi:MAG: FtsX-like permease family protein [Armatimonadetes bacterium]|nr:FtsX-like permease family protein [Armatimonadota bacterium]
MAPVRCALGILSLLLSAATVAQLKPQGLEGLYRQRVAAVSSASVRQSLETIASFGGRLPGSTGERKALEWAESQFAAIGLKNIRREPFLVTVPDPDALGSLTVGVESVALLPLWPNAARTSTCDVSGPLIYGGKGSLEELSGHKIAGSIVVLEFNSGQNWRNAAKLGAVAIVFLEPEQTDRWQAEMKFSGVPLDVPRFWLPMRLAGPALSAAAHGERAELRCRQDWVTRQTFNVIAECPGTDPSAKGEPVLFSAYADAMCVVPGLALGGEGAGSLAALVELARITQAHRGRRTALFMATAAHSLGLQGVREFIDRRLEKDPWKLLLSVSLDLSSGSSTLGSFAQGYYFDYRGEAWTNQRDLSRVLREHADALAPLLGENSGRRVLSDAVNDSDGRTWKNNIPAKFAFDCEPFIQARYNALTWATVDDERTRVDTPFDIVGAVRLGNLLQQVRTAACLTANLLEDSSKPGETSNRRIPIRASLPQRSSLVGGFATVEGRVVRFDPKQSFLPDVPVEGSLVVSMHWLKSLMGVRPTLVQYTQGPQAKYRFIGMPLASSWFETVQRRVRLAAMKLEPESGEIVYANNQNSWEQLEPFRLTTVLKSTPISVFRCVSSELYDLVDPHDLKALVFGRVLSAASDAEPTRYSLFFFNQFSRFTSDTEDACVLFTPPGYRWKLLMGNDFSLNRLVLTNGTQSSPNGLGYESRQVGEIGISEPIQISYRSASDLITLNQDRIRRFDKYRIIGQGIRELHELSKQELAAAKAAKDRTDWAEAERRSRSAWGYALSAYPLIRSTVDDVVLGVVFYLFLLIPFSYFAERLLFAARSLLRQLVGSLSIFVVCFGFLRLVHPAFEIVSNPTMIFVAFVMGALSLVVMGFVAGKFESSLKTLRAVQSGVHEVDVGRASVAVAAFNLGISNMRRRKARTALTTGTLVVMTFIVLSFTSIVTDLRLMDTPGEAPARYPGILVRNPGLDPIETSGYGWLKNLYGHEAKVVRRAWYYGADIRDTSTLALTKGDRLAEPRAVLGMDPDEADVLRPQECLLPGGRWFVPGDRRVVILPRSIAEQLRIDPSEAGKVQIQFAGQDHTVIGILEDTLLRGLTDLDGDNVEPADFTLSTRFQTQSRSIGESFRKYLRLDPGLVFLVPADEAIGLGATLRSVAVRFRDFDETKRALEGLMPRIRLNLYASVPSEKGSSGEVRMFSTRQGSKSTGLGLVLVQMLIAAVFVFGTMAAGVYERTKEIGVLSAVGLAPNHIATLFFAESLVYGVFGAVLGYFMAQGLSKAVLATGLLPGLYLNFSATSAVLSAVVVIAVVLLSTIYPARVAAKIAAPALDEEMMAHEPEGDEWREPLPFRVTRDEAAGIVAFLSEWFQAYEEYTIGDFVTSQTEVFGQSGGPDRSNEPGLFGLRTQVWIAPYDLGVCQKLELSAHPSGTDDIYQLDLTLHRESGDPENWVLVNRRFLGYLRQQFLTWRTLGDEERAKYMNSEPNG